MDVAIAPGDPSHPVASHLERIVAVRARVYEWTGPTAPLPERISLSATDMLTGDADRMRGFSFHAWLVVEVETRSSVIGIGNAALAPHICKAILDRYLAPILQDANPFDIESLWQRMYRHTIPFGRKGVTLAAISAVDIALWDLAGKLLGLPVFRMLGGRVKDRIPVYASKLYNQPHDTLRTEAALYMSQGFKAVKMRLGYGPWTGWRECGATKRRSLSCARRSGRMSI